MEFIFLLCAFAVYFLMLITIRKKSPMLKLPPGPRQLPIIGNMHQLSGGSTHRILSDLAKKYGPLMHLKIGEVSTIVISSPEVAKQIFKTHDILFSQRPTSLGFDIISYNFSDIIFSPYGNYWRQLRKIATMELLSAKRVQTFRSIREEEVLNAIRSIFSNKQSIVNLSQIIFTFTFGFTARSAFGKRAKHQDRFIHLVNQISDLLAGISIADLFPSVKLLQVFSATRRKLQAVHKEADEILENILNEHKENMNRPDYGSGSEAEDLVDVLLKIQKRGDFQPPLTDTNIRAVIHDVFAAGSETTAIVEEWAMSEMIKNPRILERAQNEVRNVFDERGNVDESRIDELKYLEAIVKETMRVHPSAPLLLPRECSEQCKINGYEIPTKAKIIVNDWAISRDPNYWNEAEIFNPDRFLDSKIDYKVNDFEYMPFGAGRRICPGISFALASIMLLLAQLLFHFDWKLPGNLKPEDLDMAENNGVSIRRKNDLKLIPIPYCRSSLNN